MVNPANTFEATHQLEKEHRNWLRTLTPRHVKSADQLLVKMDKSDFLEAILTLGRWEVLQHPVNRIYDILLIGF